MRGTWRDWTDEEEDRLLEIVNTYKDNQHWVRGQIMLAWGAVASELGRTVPSVYSRYQQIKTRNERNMPRITPAKRAFTAAQEAEYFRFIRDKKEIDATLRHCPFCYSHAEITTRRVFGRQHMFTVKCVLNGHRGNEHDKIDKAVNDWNNRPEGEEND